MRRRVAKPSFRMPQRFLARRGSGPLSLGCRATQCVPSRSCRGWWEIDCEWIPFPVVPPGVSTRLSDHSPRHVSVCPDPEDGGEGAWVVPIAALLDERRLSSMAAHPSAFGDLGDWWLAELVEDPVVDEEPEE